MVEDLNEPLLITQLVELQEDVTHHQTLISYFKRVFEAIPDGLICTDRNGLITLVNASTEMIFGFHEEDLIGKTPEIFYQQGQCYFQDKHFWFPEKNQGRKALFEAVFQTNEKTTLPVEVITAFVPNPEGDLLCYITLIRDISERKKLEINLRQMEVTFRTIADFTYDWEIWVKPDGTFQYISPSCKRITGYSAEEFMCNPSLFKEIIHKEDLKSWERHHEESQLLVQRREIQFRIIKRDGSVCWIEHACQVVLGENNELLGYRSSNRDITKRKNFEDELRVALFEIEIYKEQLEAEIAYLKEEIKLAHNHDDIIGDSNALEYVLYRIEQVANTDTTVLLLGETGTGKELFARAIHNTSTRKDRPLVKINCATLPANLIESELFGHERGSFTSAHTKQIGRFELADKATIFLDEIGELPLELQAKLLRVLQEGEFERLGGSKTYHIDVRVIAATNRNLEEDVQNGLFRKDLWYRLNVYPITAPPLRERVNDIPQLARHFTDKFARSQRKNITSIPAEVMQQLEQYHWPGNIRELENIIERSVINTQGTRLSLGEKLSPPLEYIDANLQTLEEVERSHILKVLEQVNWKVSGKNSASAILGLKRSTLRARMDKYGIQRP